MIPYPYLILIGVCLYLIIGLFIWADLGIGCLYSPNKKLIYMWLPAMFSPRLRNKLGG
jgi:hypothetical protein